MRLKPWLKHTKAFLLFLFAKNTYIIMRKKSKGIVAWKARWASHLLASEANVKTIGGEKR